MENTSIWTEEDQERYIARSREADMQSIGHLAARVLATLRTKLDGSHINTYVDQDKQEDHDDARGAEEVQGRRPEARRRERAQVAYER